MKRGNGDGCVAKLNGNRRKPYVARITKWIEEDGEYKQKRKIIGTFKTRLEAENALYLYSKGDHIEKPVKKCPTLDEVFDILNDTIEYNRSDNYYQSFKSAVKKFEEIKDIRIDRFTTFDLQNVFDDLIKQGYRKGSIQFYKTILHKAFDYAYRQEFINRNPVSNVDISLANKQKAYDANVFSPAEINILWQDNSFWSKMVLVMIYTGMRPFEALNLLKSNVDLNQRLIKITKSKTASGVRTIPICSKIYPIISSLYHSSSFNLFEIDRNSFGMTTYVKYFKILMNSYGFNHKPYDTRHTFATLLDKVNADDLSIKLILGHSVDDITKSVYTHRDFEKLKEATDLLDTIS